MNRTEGVTDELLAALLGQEVVAVTVYSGDAHTGVLIAYDRDKIVLQSGTHEASRLFRHAVGTVTRRADARVS